MNAKQHAHYGAALAVSDRHVVMAPELPATDPGAPAEERVTVPTVAGDSGTVEHLDLVRLVERVHRRFVDLLRVDLTRLGTEDLSPGQVMMLFTIGDDELTVRDLIDRGYYQGSNASYNLKQLVNAGYVERNASVRDRRSARIKVSDKGRALCELVRKIDKAYQDLVASSEQDIRDLETTFRTLRRMEDVWSNALRYGEVKL